MKNISKIIFSVKAILLVSILPLFASNESELMSLLDEASAQAECSSYISYMYKDYSVADFRSKNDAEVAEKKHLLKAQSAAEDMVNFAMKNKIEGKYFIFKKGNQTCVGEGCFEKKEYVETMFWMGGFQKAEEAVTKKDISCPEDAWYPCKGGEPVDNWGYKAGKLYKDRNCRVLLR